MNSIGIDPGKSGGIAVLDASGAVLELGKLEIMTETDMWAFLTCAARKGDVHAFLENVGSFNCRGKSAGEVLRRMPLVRMHGMLWGLLIGLVIQREEVTATVWQKALGCLTKGDKKISYRKAQELFPQVKVTHWNADALLIAEYGRRVCNQRNGV